MINVENCDYNGLSNMKKLFSKIETKIDNTSKETNNYVGKQFTVGRVIVTVEDILAEGNLNNCIMILI